MFMSTIFSPIRLTVLAVLALVIIGSPVRADVTPELEFTTLEGRKMSLSDLKGRVVVVNVFATWCGPCYLEVPELVHLQKVYAPRGVQMLGLAVDDHSSRKRVQRFAKDLQINYPVSIISPRDTLAFGGAPSLPTVFTLDRQGRLAEVIRGCQGAEVLDRAIRKLL